LLDHLVQLVDDLSRLLLIIFVNEDLYRVHTCS